MNAITMKNKAIILMITFIIFLSACSNTVKYKRINLSPQEENYPQMTIIARTDIVNQASESYSDTMPIYKITPYEITEQDLIDFAALFGFHDAVKHDDDGMYIAVEREVEKELEEGLEDWVIDGLKHEDRFEKKVVAFFSASKNEIEYSNRMALHRDEMLQSDQELEEEAKRVFEGLSFIKGEYEFIGQTATQTRYEFQGSYIVGKSYSFQPLLNGVRVIGDNYCTLNFNADGISRVSLSLYSYKRIGEMDMIPLDKAIKQIKKPDAFTIDNEDFKGAADSLCIERTKLLYVNQYTEGCEILQPVYNLMGTVTNKSGSSEFSAKIIAIPKKYTYE